MIPVIRSDGSGLSNLEPLYVQLVGPRIGHHKVDFCSLECFKRWVGYLHKHADTGQLVS